MVVIEHPVPRYRKLAIQWFDFELVHQEKSALLQAFPKVLNLLKEELPTVTLVCEKQPRGKECVADTIALAFVGTLPEEARQQLREDPDSAKYAHVAEYSDFLRLLKIACLRSNHTPAFKT